MSPSGWKPQLKPSEQINFNFLLDFDLSNKFWVHFLVFILSIGLILVLAACQDRGATPPSTEIEAPTDLTPSQVLVLGDVAGDPAWSIEHFQPLADHCRNASGTAPHCFGPPRHG